MEFMLQHLKLDTFRPNCYLVASVHVSFQGYSFFSTKAILSDELACIGRYTFNTSPIPSLRYQMICAEKHLDILSDTWAYDPSHVRVGYSKYNLGFRNTWSPRRTIHQVMPLGLQLGGET